MKISDENFIAELKKRNQDALEHVLKHYGWIIKATVSKHLYNLSNYEDDCINDILLAVWNNINSFDEERGDFKNWLAGVSKYKCIDYRRKYLKHIKHENIDDLNLRTHDLVIEDIISKEISKDLNDLLNCLKKEDREIFIKLYIEEKEIEDISLDTGLKKDVIYNRLSRGRRKMRNIFKLIESRE